MAAAPRVINLVFDGPPAPHGPHLVEITDDQGRSATLPPGGPRLVEIEDDTGRSIAIGVNGSRILTPFRHLNLDPLLVG